MSGNHDHIKNLKAWHAARLECFARDDYTCTCTGCARHAGMCHATTDLQADHIIPLAVLFAAGIDSDTINAACDVDALTTLCKPCNITKGARESNSIVRGAYVHPDYAELFAFVVG